MHSSTVGLIIEGASCGLEQFYAGPHSSERATPRGYVMLLLSNFAIRVLTEVVLYQVKLLVFLQGVLYAIGGCKFRWRSDSAKLMTDSIVRSIGVLPLHLVHVRMVRGKTRARKWCYVRWYVLLPAGA